MLNILVTGATGNVGSEVVRFLPDDVHLRLAVLNPDITKSTFGDNVEYVQFDFLRPETFQAALQGIDKVFLLRPPSLGNVKIFEPFIEQAQSAGVQHIIFLSIQGVERVPYVPHARIEALIRESGIAYTFLRAGFFMQNLNTTHRQEIAQDNTIFIPAGKSKTAFVDVRDIGAVAAHILSEDGHENTNYTLTGSELLDYEQVAAIFSEVLKLDIRYHSPMIPIFIWQMWRRGMPITQAFIVGFLYLITRFGQATQVHPDTAQLLDRQPITMRQYVEDYRDSWS